MHSVLLVELSAEIGGDNRIRTYGSYQLHFFSKEIPSASQTYLRIFGGSPGIRTQNLTT